MTSVTTCSHSSLLPAKWDTYHVWSALRSLILRILTAPRYSPVVIPEPAWGRAGRWSWTVQCRAQTASAFSSQRFLVILPGAPMVLAISSMVRKWKQCRIKGFFKATRLVGACEAQRTVPGTYYSSPPSGVRGTIGPRKRTAEKPRSRCLQLENK